MWNDCCEQNTESQLFKKTNFFHLKQDLCRLKIMCNYALNLEVSFCVSYLGRPISVYTVGVGGLSFAVPVFAVQ